MQVIGFNFEKINAERYGNLRGRLELKSNINISDIKEDEIQSIEKKPLKFSFDVAIDYNPDFAKLSFKGFIIALFDDKQKKEILSKWKDKKVAESVREEIMNVIFTKTNLKAFQLAEELGLPLHIPLPRLSLESEKKNTEPKSYAG
ncbi:hypothetical protein HYV49_02200 [Candidatus Pacearchaeota archaeon]|nr:hypothetical protein [Candidatus Pacearchaeota archaeon]